MERSNRKQELSHTQDPEALRRQTELFAEIGEEESLLDLLKTMCRTNKLAVFSAVVIILIALAAIFAPLVAPYDPNKQDLLNRIIPAVPKVFQDGCLIAE